MAKSYMQKNKECYLCRKFYGIENTVGLHEHHIFEGNANRRISEEIGAKIWLCAKHHNMSNYGIHFNKGVDLEVKKEAQMRYEKDHSREEFIEKIGRSYL